MNIFIIKTRALQQRERLDIKSVTRKQMRREMRKSLRYEVRCCLSYCSIAVKRHHDKEIFRRNLLIVSDHGRQGGENGDKQVLTF